MSYESILRSPGYYAKIVKQTEDYLKVIFHDNAEALHELTKPMFFESDIFYFMEDVDIMKDGNTIKIVGTPVKFAKVCTDDKYWRFTPEKVLDENIICKDDDFEEKVIYTGFKKIPGNMFLNLITFGICGKDKYEDMTETVMHLKPGFYPCKNVDSIKTIIQTVENYSIVNYRLEDEE